MWKDVLVELRRSMRNLEWISLTGIGYAEPPLTGAEMPEELAPGDGSDDDSDHSDSGWYHSQPQANGGRSTESSTAGPSNSHSHDSNSSLDHDDFYDYADSDEDNRGDIHEIEFLDLNPADRSSATVPCNCSELALTDAAEVLKDNGGPIEWNKAKDWERWVVNRCVIHGRR